MAKKNNTITYIIAGILFLGGVGYLLYSGFNENSVYFLNVTEAKAVSPEKLNNIRLFGTVAAGNLDKNANGLGVSFNLEDKDDRSNTVRVIYNGVIPDTFKEGAEVIVEGSMQKEGNFVATLVMTKCPSKYQKENRKI